MSTKKIHQTSYDEKQKLWTGLKTRPLYNPEISLGDILLRSMEANGPKIAQISDDSGVQLTFDDIRRRTIQAAISLQTRGYEPGQVFSFMARNSENLAPLVLAAFCLGCPANAFDTSLGKNEIKHMLNIVRPSLVFCDVDVHDLLVECLGELRIVAKVITLGGKVGSSEQVEDLLVESEFESSYTPATINGAQHIAAILCSSGTTGLPKGVSLSHAAVLEAQSNFKLVQSHDVLLCFSQVFWISGYMSLIWGTLFGATRLITTERFAPELAFRLLPQYKVSFVLTAIPQMVSMLKHPSADSVDFLSLRHYCVAGSKVPPGLLAEFNQFFPHGDVVNCMGMTEISGFCSQAFVKDYREECVGQLRHNMVVKIVDEKGSSCGVDADGEVCYKPFYAPLGYYRNPEATKDLFDDDGFLLSGDIGHFDEDGNLYIVDRKKDMLKYIGYQITPSEIEAVLIKSPEIQAVCVVGIPDIAAIDLPAAAVIRKAGSKVTEHEISAMVVDNLADHYKLRGGVYFVESLPLTPSGKLLRRVVKENLIELFNKRDNSSINPQ